MNSRETTLRKEVSRLKRALAKKTLEVDFFTGALRTVTARRQRTGDSGGTGGENKMRLDAARDEKL